MKFTPDYNVIYKGYLREAGETFEIDEADAVEMSLHGEIEDKSAPSIEENAKEKPRRGRPPKEVKHEAD